MKSNLDVYAIQKYKDETLTALKKVKKDSLGNILYLNCRSTFKINGNNVKGRNFNACFYSEDSDVVIFFAKGKISEEEIVNYLEQEDVKYTTIRFEEDERRYEDDENIPEIWFVRESYVLEDALQESIDNGDKQCVYYPTIKSTLQLGFNINGKERCEIEGRCCRGLLYFKDKVLLFVEQRDDRNMNYNDIIKVLDKYHMKYKVKNNVR